MIVMRLWRRLVKRLSRTFLPEARKKVVHTSINGYQLLVLANEEVGRSIYFGRNYESEETTYLKSFLSIDSVCMDIGANIGYFALLMASCSPQGRVYAFEPIELNAALLKASAALNRISNVEVINCAVGATIGKATFSQSVDSAYSSLHPTDRNPHERDIFVTVTTVDQFVKQNCLGKIDVLKADVEGAEGLVISGASILLSDATRRPRLVFLELYQPNLDPFKTDILTIVAMMRNFGYSPFYIGAGGVRVPYSDSAKRKYYNVFFQQ